MSDKEQAAEILRQIMRAIKDAMQTGEATILVYSDAEILIRRRQVVEE